MSRINKRINNCTIYKILNIIQFTYYYEKIHHLLENFNSIKKSFYILSNYHPISNIMSEQIDM